MAHYAFLDENNVVTEVITGVDETELLEGKTPEQWYGEFKGQRCKRTSYNTFSNQHLNGSTPFRGNYAGIGFTYDDTFDVFIPPKPFPSWKLNYTTYQWEAPIAMPSGSTNWVWSEHNQEWISVSFIK